MVAGFFFEWSAQRSSSCLNRLMYFTESEKSPAITAGGRTEQPHNFQIIELDHTTRTKINSRTTNINYGVLQIQ